MTKPIDAIVYLPGLGGPLDGFTGPDVARRMSDALRDASHDGRAEFAVSDCTWEETYGDSHRTRIKRITKSRDGDPVAAIDVFELNYSNTLTGSLRDRTAIVRGLVYAVTLFWNMPRTVGLLFRSSTSTKLRDRVQLWVLLILMSLLSAYLFFLLAALLQTTSTVFHGLLSKVFGWDVPHLKGLGQFSVQLVVVSSGFVAFFDKTRSQAQKIASEYLSMISYMQSGERLGPIVAQVSDLVDYVSTRGEYRNIHLFGYSFGSMVIFDALFPLSGGPAPRFQRVHTFVSVGFPGEILRALWPSAFRNRSRNQSVPRRWLNVHSEMDVMSSPIRRIDAFGAVNATPSDHEDTRVEDLEYCHGRRAVRSILGYLTFLAVRTHAMYWERKYERGANCFDTFMPRLVADATIHE